MSWGNSSFAGNAPMYAGSGTAPINFPGIVVNGAFVGSELAGATGVGSDTSQLSQVCRGVNCGAAGTVSVAYVDGTSDSFYALQGVDYQRYITQVFKTGTSATGIHGLH